MEIMYLNIFSAISAIIILRKVKAFQESLNSDDNFIEILNNKVKNLNKSTAEQEFLSRIFEKYGNKTEMSFEGFEHLLINLGLGNLNITDHDINDHRTDSGYFKEFHENHIHWIQDSHHRVKTGAFTQDMEDKRHNDSTPEERNAGDVTLKKRMRRSSHVLNDPFRQCLPAESLLLTFDLTSRDKLNSSLFLHMCPAIIYQLDARACQQEASRHRCADCYNDKHHADHDSHEEETSSKFYSVKDIPLSTWLWATLAVSVISIVGFLCVGVIPLLQQLQAHAFRAVLQFLVALAIGTLTGDALLHLIPHAMVPHDTAHDDHEHESTSSHKQPVIVGLFVLGGLYVFFVMERVVAVIGQWKRSKKQQKAEVKNSPRTLQETIGAKLSTQHESEKLIEVTAERRISNGSKQNRSLHSVNSNLDEFIRSNQIIDSHANIHRDIQTRDSSIDTRSSDPEEEEETGHHGHSHSLPGDSMSSIVWTVIMGDGFHNFCDGLAIGAAFASSITGGFSTSVAVFFHELPHEIGDFAVLLSAGMSTKKALFYNVVSSVLCFIGLVLGILMGNFSSATPFIFALTGGMFIYISLADMLPELTTSVKGSSSITQTQVANLVLQCIGISTGLSIMLLIAWYEDALSQLLQDLV